MARQCAICKKKPLSGNNVSHSNIKTKTRWLPNLRRVKALIKKGTVRRIRVCTRCIGAGLVTKAA